MPAAAGRDLNWARLGRSLAIFARFAIAAAAIWLLAMYLAAQVPAPVKLGDPKAGFASTGQEIWVTPGYTGSVDVYSRNIEGAGGYWDATPSLKLVLHGPSGRADIVGTSDKKQDWGNSPYKHFEPIVMTLSIAVPADAAVGSDWQGGLTGQIVTGSGFEGLVLPAPIDVNLQDITLHVTSADEVMQRAGMRPDNTIWTLTQWGLSTLVLLLGVLVAYRMYQGRSIIPERIWRPGR
jgi:hypothetical protein